MKVRIVLNDVIPPFALIIDFPCFIFLELRTDMILKRFSLIV